MIHRYICVYRAMLYKVILRHIYLQGKYVRVSERRVWKNIKDSIILYMSKKYIWSVYESEDSLTFIYN